MLCFSSASNNVKLAGINVFFFQGVYSEKKVSLIVHFSFDMYGFCLDNFWMMQAFTCLLYASLDLKDGWQRIASSLKGKSSISLPSYNLLFILSL